MHWNELRNNLLNYSQKPYVRQKKNFKFFDPQVPKTESVNSKANEILQSIITHIDLNKKKEVTSRFH